MESKLREKLEVLKQKTKDNSNLMNNKLILKMKIHLLYTKKL